MSDATTKKLMGAVATLMAAPTNRFGKPEFHSDEERAAREFIREMAIRLDVRRYANCDTVLHQAAAVVRAVMETGGA